jgi:hypothetical protein
LQRGAQYIWAYAVGQQDYYGGGRGH